MLNYPTDQESMSESCILWIAASVAAPSRKLWPAYNDGLLLHSPRAVLSEDTKWSWVRGRPSEDMTSELPRTKYPNVNVTGQMSVLVYSELHASWTCHTLSVLCVPTSVTTYGSCWSWHHCMRDGSVHHNTSLKGRLLHQCAENTKKQRVFCCLQP